MRKFSYEARDQASGQIIKSALQADSESIAGKLLISQGLVPLKIKEIEDGSSFFARISNRITTKDKVVFTRQLATLIGAGLPLTQCFDTVLGQTQNKRLQAIVQEIMVDVEGGKSLSAAFAAHPKQFNNVFISLVAAGEASGTLDIALSRIATQQEKDAAVVSKIRGAMTYPIIVLVVIVGVMLFMLFTVVPQVEKLYSDLKQEMPFISKALVSVANFGISYWWILLIILVIVVVALRQYIITSPGIEFKDRIKLNIPFFKTLYNKLYMARFTRTGQTLLSSGVTMLDMLHITAKSINNVHLDKAIMRASEKVKGGKALSAALEDEPLVNSLVPQMIRIGEQSGKIDEMMGKVAQVYEDELDEAIKTISTLIEPVLMIVMALFAGVMVAAILLPIYSLVSNINIS